MAFRMQKMIRNGKMPCEYFIVTAFAFPINRPLILLHPPALPLSPPLAHLPDFRHFVFAGHSCPLSHILWPYLPLPISPYLNPPSSPLCGDRSSFYFGPVLSSPMASSSSTLVFPHFRGYVLVHILYFYAILLFT